MTLSDKWQVKKNLEKKYREKTIWFAHVDAVAQQQKI